MMDYTKNTNITVSLTSYPERINCVPKVIDCLTTQSILPTRVVLYLAKDQFKRKNSDLPNTLLKLAEHKKLEIHWCELDLKPHKKYYYAMQEYPDDVIITVDDDIYLPDNTLEELILCWKKHPNAIAARRTHLITFNQNGEILPYLDWIHGYNIMLDTPSMQLMGTGCSGILYPPHSLPPAAFDATAIIENALYGDDLWLKAHTVMQNIPVVSVTENIRLQEIEGSQECALYKENMFGSRNDEYLKKISHYIDKLYGGENVLQTALYSSSVGVKLLGQEPVLAYVKKLRKDQLNTNKELKITKKKLNSSLNREALLKQSVKKLEIIKKKLNSSLNREVSLKQSVSFRLGRGMTWLPRKIREGIRHLR